MSQLLSLSVSYSSPSPLSFSPLFHTDQTAALCSFPPFLYCPFIMKHLSSSHISVPILSFPSLFSCVLSKTTVVLFISRSLLSISILFSFSPALSLHVQREPEKRELEQRKRREEKRREKEKDMRRKYREYMFTWISVFKPLLLPLLLPLFPLSNKCQSMQTRCLTLLLLLFSLLL